MECVKAWAGPRDCRKPCQEQGGARLGQTAAWGAMHGRKVDDYLSVGLSCWYRPRLDFGGVAAVDSAETALGFRGGSGGDSVRILRGEDVTRRPCGEVSGDVVVSAR
jgi:hypothetical protein